MALLTKDKRLPDAEREASYANGLMNAPWQVQVCKLADVNDNLSDIGGLGDDHRARATRRARFYLDKLAANLRPEARAACEIVHDLLQSLIDAS